MDAIVGIIVDALVVVSEVMFVKELVVVVVGVATVVVVIVAVVVEVEVEVTWEEARLA